MKFGLSLIRIFSKALLYFSALMFSWVICLYLRSDVPPPRPVPTAAEWEKAKTKSQWLDKSQYGINHIFLRGSAFERGLAWGKLSGDRLLRQEKVLVDMYKDLIPSKTKQKILETGVIATFEGLQESFEPWMTEEMWGVSQSASPQFNYLASPYARQLAYHGIHEVGQLFVDLAPLEGACTFVSLPLRSKGEENNSWIVGRTFDFEGGRIFDEEKVLKWVYPEIGFKYVSLIWTGMVGAVSGVNEKGIYVSVNAAGSKEINLTGLPSTLIITKVLQEAANIEDALRIFRDSNSMITDIYMVLDSNSGRLFKVEKGAFSLDMTEVKTATAVTNHLFADAFKDDEFNQTRRDDFTSTFRLKRAQFLLNDLANSPRAKSSREKLTENLLQILRDKGVGESKAGASPVPLHLGNRRAIDALIASHGVLYDSKLRHFYVSEGPSMSGAFKGYDLEKSFAAGKPVELKGFPADPQVSREVYFELKEKLSQLKHAFDSIHNYNCPKAYEQLSKMNFNHVEYEYAMTAAANCLHKYDEAKKHAELGISLFPPQSSLQEYFEKTIAGDFK
jgi:isopenicillin-N N-acyltransferase-like protein